MRGNDAARPYCGRIHGDDMVVNYVVVPHGKVSVRKFTYLENFPDMYTMFKAMNTKYLTYGAGLAPIEPFLVKYGYVMADMMTILDDASTDHSNELDDYVASHLALESRDSVWSVSRKKLYLVRNYIITLNINSPRAAALYGIPVHEALPHEVNQLSKASPMEETLINGLVKDNHYFFHHYHCISFPSLSMSSSLILFSPIFKPSIA